ncbi:MAG: arsenate reductase, partial [Aquabacterium sp.]|uniref:ArsC/Spx/MgsR family protein n=1 Tax=Aquabacterium sp. TaxID=1872578 RepID=UPI001215FC8E
QDCGLRARQVMRDKGDLYEELQLQDNKWTDDQLIDFMIAHPALINRPIVVTSKGTRLCRPSELVLDILDAPQQGPFSKEDGEVVIDAQGKRLK